MFYLMVEEYMMQNRQHELAKDLKLRRQLADSPDSLSDNVGYLIAGVTDQLRNLLRTFRMRSQVSQGQIALPRDCATC
jgi:hypothetical protein